MPQENNTRTLIFDFDGTIADTHQYIVEISNRLADEFCFRKMTPEEALFLKGKTSQEVIDYLGVPLMKIPLIVARAKKEFETGLHALKPFEGLHGILLKLKSIGFQIGILSSNASQNVEQFLNNHQLNIFDFVETTSKIWSKNTSLKQLMKSRQLTQARTVYIGDEVRDIVAAHRLGLPVAAVTWGFNSAPLLKKHAPDYLFHCPEDLLNLR